MPWVLGLTIVLLVVALVVVAVRGVPAARRAEADSRGIGMMIVGLAMVGFGVISALADWNAASFAVPGIGLVFVAVGSRRRREGAGRGRRRT